MYHLIHKELEDAISSRGTRSCSDVTTEFYNKGIGKQFKLSWFFIRSSWRYLQIYQRSNQPKRDLDKNYFLSGTFTFLGYRTGGEDDNVYDRNTEWFNFENHELTFTVRLFRIQTDIFSILYKVK